MPHIVTRLCQTCKHTACVTVCPVDCFYVLVSPEASGLPDQLYISPKECIDCFACIPECPWEAIFEEPDVPGLFKDDAAINALVDTRRDEFQRAPENENPNPSEEEIAANKKKWGLAD